VVTSVAVTVAPGAAAPEESTMVPVRVVVTTCALECEAKISTRARKARSALIGAHFETKDLLTGC
jgi:hypothetical protein